VLIFSNEVFSQTLPTGKKTENNLNSWVGSTEAELIKSWGVPNSSYTLSNGDIVLQYDLRSSPTSQQYCKINITFSKGIIKDWMWEGNNCA
jgi:hypothetical protein